MPPDDQLKSLQHALQTLREDPLTTQAFVRLARNQTELAAALPTRFDEVLQQLLDRLESSALFSEESCSFSQRDVLDSLQDWMEKAAPKLASTSAPKA